MSTFHLLGRHAVVVDHAAELVHLVVQEGALLGSELGLVRIEKCAQRRRSTENVPVEAHRAAAQADLLRIGDLGHHLLCKVVAHARDEGAGAGARPRGHEPPHRHRAHFGSTVDETGDDVRQARRALTMLALLGGAAGLHGSPLWLDGLAKAGKGHDSRWLLAEYRGEGHALTFSLGLDRMPAARCTRLLVLDAAVADDQRGRPRKVGFMLLENQADGSALRGLKVEEAYRGQGHSGRLLAGWARLCLEASAVPCTRVINKPILALGLGRLGFRPRTGRGVAVRVTGAKRLRDCDEVSVTDIYLYVPSYLPIYLSIYPMFVSICLSFFLSIYLSIYIYLAIYLSIHLSIYIFYVSICLSVYLSICPSFYRMYLSVCLTIYLSIYLSTYPSSFPSIFFLYLSICLSIYLSIYQRT